MFPEHTHIQAVHVFPYFSIRDVFGWNRLSELQVGCISLKASQIGDNFRRVMDPSLSLAHVKAKKPEVRAVNNLRPSNTLLKVLLSLIFLLLVKFYVMIPQTLHILLP